MTDPAELAQVMREALEELAPKKPGPISPHLARLLALAEATHEVITEESAHWLHAEPTYPTGPDHRDQVTHLATHAGALAALASLALMTRTLTGIPPTHWPETVEEHQELAAHCLAVLADYVEAPAR